MIANPLRRITTYIVDDSPLMCEALTALLGRELDFEVLGHATDSDDGFPKDH